MDDDSIRATLASLLPERLHRLRRLTDVPVVFGGTTVFDATSTPGEHLVLDRLEGTWGSGLHGLRVPTGTGLGGRVVHEARPQRVGDYATTTSITHEYDGIVVQQERLTSMCAVPVVVAGKVRGVLYAAARGQTLVGDRATRVANAVAEDLQRAIDERLRVDVDEDADVLTELADIIANTADDATRARLQRVYSRLGGEGVRGTVELSPREIDVLRVVALGVDNLGVAVRLGLRPETVKSYLRSAMRKLGVHNRTAAVHAARIQGLL